MSYWRSSDFHIQHVSSHLKPMGQVFANEETFAELGAFFGREASWYL